MEIKKIDQDLKECNFYFTEHEISEIIIKYVRENTNLSKEKYNIGTYFDIGNDGYGSQDVGYCLDGCTVLITKKN